MKKFLLLYCGTPELTDDRKAVWMAWFAEVGTSMVDSGNPLGSGRLVTSAAASDLPVEFTGYSLITAESAEAAEQIAATSPAAAGVRVYEAIAM